MDWREIVFIILLAGGMLGPTAFYRQWWLFSVFAIFFAVFGLVEWYSVSKTGLSVTNHFGAFGKIHPKSAWGIIVGMFVGWMSLLWHFAIRIIR